jgi:hypothetical protein
MFKKRTLKYLLLKRGDWESCWMTTILSLIAPAVQIGSHQRKIAKGTRKQVNIKVKMRVSFKVSFGVITIAVIRRKTPKMTPQIVILRPSLELFFGNL